MPIDSRLGRLDVSGSPGLNFNEAKNSRIPAYQIDLASAAWRAIVSCHYRVTLPSQIEVGVFFALRTRTLMLRTIVWRQDASREPVQTLYYSLKKTRGKHEFSTIRTRRRLVYRSSDFSVQDSTQSLVDWKESLPKGGKVAQYF